MAALFQTGKAESAKPTGAAEEQSGWTRPAVFFGVEAGHSAGAAERTAREGKKEEPEARVGDANEIVVGVAGWEVLQQVAESEANKEPARAASRQSASAAKRLAASAEVFLKIVAEQRGEAEQIESER